MLGSPQPSSAIRCSSYPYSPECVEQEFSEVRMQHPVYFVLIGPGETDSSWLDV